MTHNSPEYLHLLVEALKLVYADRERYNGDPEFVDVPIDGLLSRAYARAHAQQIDSEKAHPDMPPYGNPWSYSHQPRGWQTTPKASHSAVDEGPESFDTSYLCVVDRYGHVLSATSSNGSSSCPVMPGLGFVDSSRGLQSWADPGHASSGQPWKRPRLTPNPALVLKDGKPLMALGTPGGDVQCQAMVQAFFEHCLLRVRSAAGGGSPTRGLGELPELIRTACLPPRQLNIETSMPRQRRRTWNARGTNCTYGRSASGGLGR